jgi:hypothetical protein
VYRCGCATAGASRTYAKVGFTFGRSELLEVAKK